jgi:hypothetical protein
VTKDNVTKSEQAQANVVAEQSEEVAQVILSSSSQRRTSLRNSLTEITSEIKTAMMIWYTFMDAETSGFNRSKSRDTPCK